MGFPREAFRQVISDYAGGVATTWAPAPLGYQAGTRVILRFAGSKEVGWDDTAETFDETLLVRSVSSIERRLVRITARVDSFDPTQAAADIAERLRTRLYRETARLALDAIGVSYLGSEGLSTVPWPIDGREGESAILDLKFYSLRLEVQTDNEGGVIETVEVSGAPTV